ncbi:MAG: hypothetical protein CSA22_00585 [Deltaproteobacteria bacterium]|nr:MAG: hypothetical protein CSA22_00585 [Deltaproteobacteria bacterium]
MRKEWVTRLLTGMSVVILTASLAAGAERTVRIGIVSDGPVIRFDLQVDLIQTEIKALTSGEFAVLFPADKQVQGDWTARGVVSAFDQLLSDPEVDLILALGTLASHIAGHVPALTKPVIAPLVIDAALQNMPVNSDGTSGKKNLLYINTFQHFERDVRVFHDIIPFTRLVILADEQIIAGVPGIRKRGGDLARKYGFEPQLITVAHAAAPVLEQIPSDTQAVMISPLVRLNTAEMQALIDGLNALKLPSFSLWGRPEVEMGVLAAMAPERRTDRIARRIALDVQQILLGTPPESIPVGFQTGHQLVLNMRTARQIGVYPPWSVLIEAELLYAKQGQTLPRLTLSEAVRHAQTHHPQLKQARAQTAEKAGAAAAARSRLFPQLHAGLGLSRVDADSAASSFGSRAEQALVGSLGFSQVIYHEQAWANAAIQKIAVAAADAATAEQEQDISLSCAVWFLNLLKAQTLLQIRKEDLKLTIANMDRARGRRAVGISSPAEVYRWESVLANARKSVLVSQARERQAAIALNQLMGKPISAAFQLVEPALKDPFFLISDPQIFAVAQSPGKSEHLMHAAVSCAFSTSYRLKQIDAKIKAKKREQTAAKRAFYLPDVHLEAGLSHQLKRSGEAADGVTVSVGTAAFDMDPPEDRAWKVEILATYPVFDSGLRKAEAGRINDQLSALLFTRKAVCVQIETAVRKAFHSAGASYPGIGLSRKAAASARKNLALVTDAYERGVMSIIDLLDAQNAALHAELGAANAVFDFLIDLANIQRLLGQVDFSADPDLKIRLIKALSYGITD